VFILSSFLTDGVFVTIFEERVGRFGDEQQQDYVLLLDLKMRTIRAQISLIILAGYLAGGLAPYPGFVVCAHHDGLTKLESASNRCCDELADS